MVIFLQKEDDLETILYLLVFIFGYYTCKTFYVYRSGSLTVGMLKMCHMASLMVLVRALEQYSYVRQFGIQQLKAKGASENEIKNFDLYIDNDIKFFKHKSISNLVGVTPTYFKQVLKFEDWDSAMDYMNANKELVEQIIKYRG